MNGKVFWKDQSVALNVKDMIGMKQKQKVNYKMTIKELDEWCRLRNRCILTHKGQMYGFSKGYKVK